SVLRGKHHERDAATDGERRDRGHTVEFVDVAARLKNIQDPGADEREQAANDRRQPTDTWPRTCDGSTAERGNGWHDRVDVQVLLRRGEREEDHDRRDPDPEEASQASDVRRA